MAKENKDMDKKVMSSPARLSTCEAKGKDNGRSNGNKTQRFNKGKREPPQGRNPPDPNGNSQSRRPTPQKSRAMDKRPRSRGLPGSRRDEVTVTQRAEFGSALPQGPKKINMNHLLNFTLAPRESEDSRGGGWHGRRGWGHRHPRFNKEQFLQANCQFVVKASGDYKQQCVDPDTLVDWDLIEQVRMLGHEMPSCPICLAPPAAAKITKCGHIYCWPCILHYISLGEKKWRKCPICYESVMANDLKSVVAKSLKTYSIGDTITMRLMMREKGSVIVQPHYPDRAPIDTPASPCMTDIPEETCFAKLMIASPNEVKDKILQRERRELEQQLKESDDDFEKSFVQRALDSLKERENCLCLVSDPSSAFPLDSSLQGNTDDNILDSSRDEENEMNCSNTSIPTKEDCVVYASAFSDEEVDEMDDTPQIIPEEEEEEQQQQQQQQQTDDPQDSVSAAQPDSITETIDSESKEDQVGDVAGSMSLQGGEESSAQSGKEDDGEKNQEPDEGKERGDDFGTSPDLDAGVPRERERKTSRQASNIYFYQAEDGQHMYLGSLNARCMMHEYGTLEHSPLTITAKLVEIEHVSITQDMRNRMRHLQHLPMTCEVCVCELDLRPPTVSARTLARFSTEIQKKKQKRDKKARDEKRRERKIRQEEDRKNGIYPKPRYSLQSTNQFPSFSPGATESPDPPRPISPAYSVDSAASSNYSAALSDVHDDDTIFGSPQHVERETSHHPPADVSTSPSGGAAGGAWPSLGSPDTQGGHRSFAQMLRDGVAKPSSPMKPGTPQHTASGSSYFGKVTGREAHSSNDSDNEDYVPVPQYKDAFSNAIQDALDKAACMSLKKDDVPDGEAGKGGGGGGGGGGGRKNKKGRKKQLLFSTAGPRFK